MWSNWSITNQAPPWTTADYISLKHTADPPLSVLGVVGMLYCDEMSSSAVNLVLDSYMELYTCDPMTLSFLLSSRVHETKVYDGLDKAKNFLW